jgi:hypothetical protein
MYPVKIVLIGFCVKLAELLPTSIEFHKKLVYMVFFLIKDVKNCEHSFMLVDKPYCQKCQLYYTEIMELPFQEKEFLILKAILDGKYTNHKEK